MFTGAFWHSINIPMNAKLTTKRSDDALLGENSDRTGLRGVAKDCLCVAGWGGGGGGGRSGKMTRL